MYVHLYIHTFVIMENRECLGESESGSVQRGESMQVCTSMCSYVKAEDVICVGQPSRGAACGASVADVRLGAGSLRCRYYGVGTDVYVC